ncbi:MAG: two pore domain potassium channel family protein [Proteobacteria bacterium]|nr:two pore domain potassium channel family protein [Pseudomonadota bacterium]
MAVDTTNQAGKPLFYGLGANAILLLALFVLLAVVPFLPGHQAENLVSRIVWSIVIVAGLARSSGNRFFLWAALIIAGPTLASRWIDIPGGAMTGSLAVALFLLLISAHILVDIFARRQIGIDQIFGSVNVYLLLGVLFARLHLAVAIQSPDAYMMGDISLAAAVSQAGQELEDVLYYFSFTTMTTLGYGDIWPVSQAARMLSMGEAVVGQLFIAILIARIVGVHAAQSADDT